MAGSVEVAAITFDVGRARLPKDAPTDLQEFFAISGDELGDTWITQQDRYSDMVKVRDQLQGGKRALSKRYHDMPVGLTENQRLRVEKARKHVNLVEPALDRLVNSIHAGKISRKAPGNDPLHRALRREAHGAAMARLCENAFGYGTGYLVPVVSDSGRITYWTPDPLWSVLVVDPRDVHDVRGLVALIRSVDDARTLGFRFITDKYEGTFWYSSNELVYAEHGLGGAPLVVAYGRDQRHRGQKYGKSLVLSAADGSIQVTNNEMNLELLRDRQTQALLLIYGEPENTKRQTQETTQKYLQWLDREKGGAEFITPESRIEDVIKLTERFATDASIGTGLPLDTFRPELVTGSDASATAARQRAFPLQQRMVRMQSDWMVAEIAAAGAIGAQLVGLPMPEGGDWSEIAELLGVEISMEPSVPQSEAEALSNWQQKTEKFFCPVEEAIEYYSPHLSEEIKAELAETWKRRHQSAPVAMRAQPPPLMVARTEETVPDEQNQPEEEIENG